MNTATVAIARLERASSSTGSRLRTGSGGGARAAWIRSGGTPAPWRVCWALAAREAPCTRRLSCSSISPLATSWPPSTTARSRLPSRTAASASAALAGCRSRIRTPTASPWAVRAGPSDWEAGPTRPTSNCLSSEPNSLGRKMMAHRMAKVTRVEMRNERSRRVRSTTSRLAVSLMPSKVLMLRSCLHRLPEQLGQGRLHAAEQGDAAGGPGRVQHPLLVALDGQHHPPVVLLQHRHPVQAARPVGGRVGHPHLPAALPAGGPQLLDRPGGDQPAPVDDGDRLAQPLHQLQLVAGEDHR